jgi:hypothetical protein
MRSPPARGRRHAPGDCTPFTREAAAIYASWHSAASDGHRLVAWNSLPNERLKRLTLQQRLGHPVAISSS